MSGPSALPPGAAPARAAQAPPPPPDERAGARGAFAAPLLHFFQALREAGLRVSVAESIDAFAAVSITGFAEREALKDALGLVLAKTLAEKEAFARCFDLFFARDALSALAGAAEPPSAEAPAGDGAALAEMLLAGDGAALAAAMEAAANAVGVSEISFFTQANIYGRRILDAMGLEALDREIEALRRDAAPAAAARADQLETQRRRLGQAVRDFVRRQLALYADGRTQAMREAFLSTARLTTLDRGDFQRMHVLVRVLAKRLASKHARIRRRARRGQLDLRRTLRRNMATDGMLFRTSWKRQKIERPKVMAICDVSGSVASVARFLLLFLYSMHEVMAGLRAFAFSDRLIEVSDLLERNDIEPAIAAVLRAVGFGSSDYGRSLEDFERGWLPLIDRQTSIIIIGDGRGNYANPRTDILEAIHKRCKRLIWLNPEPRSLWGSGDSDMLRYRPYCHYAGVCNSLRHIERALTDLLER
ncbi:MAG TPA: VWA domain-containing protein [Stellaceae bacterium]|nr:VWA domain-containing protein [Stellaceae bacterium]